MAIAASSFRALHFPAESRAASLGSTILALAVSHCSAAA